MDSVFVTNERMLSLVTEQLNNVLNRVISGNNADAVGVCGFPCVGDCQTCTQSNADLAAFFGVAQEPLSVVMAAEVSASVEGSGPSAAEPESEPEVQVMAYAGDEDSALEVARAMDALDEVQRSGEAYDYDEYDGDCECLECRTGHVPENWHDDRDDDYDDGYGLDWNESGYFD